MKTTMNKIMIALQALAAALLIGAIKIWAPVCGKMLDLANGNQTHMKCYWAGQAGFAVAVILLIAAVMALLAKKEYKGFMFITAVCGALLCMGPAIELLREAFVLSPSVWTNSMAAICGITGIVLAVVLGFASAVSPALKSASMDPQTAITRGEVN